MHTYIHTSRRSYAWDPHFSTTKHCVWQFPHTVRPASVQANRKSYIILSGVMCLRYAWGRPTKNPYSHPYTTVRGKGPRTLVPTRILLQPGFLPCARIVPDDAGRKVARCTFFWPPPFIVFMSNKYWVWDNYYSNLTQKWWHFFVGAGVWFKSGWCTISNPSISKSTGKIPWSYFFFFFYWFDKNGNYEYIITRNLVNGRNQNITVTPAIYSIHRSRRSVWTRRVHYTQHQKFSHSSKKNILPTK